MAGAGMLLPRSISGTTAVPTGSQECSVKITRDTEYRRHLLDSQRSRMGVGERRAGIHVSDLVMCARKAWAERVTQHVPQISDETILTWLRGLSHEALLTDGIEQVRSGYCFQCQQNHPWSPELAEDQLCPDCGETLLTGTIDWVTLEDEPTFSEQEKEHHQMHHGWRDGPMSDCPTCSFEKKEPRVLIDFTPVEMKSTLKSSRKSIEDGDMLWFVDQIKSYMFMHKRMKGRIAVLHVMGDYSRTDPNVKSEGPKADLRVYQVEWESEQEMLDWGVELQISKAVVEEETTMPPLDLRSPRHNMICEYCVIGAMLPSGSPCENYPWTSDGLRIGSNLSKKYTMDEIEDELGTLGTSTINNKLNSILTEEMVRIAASKLMPPPPIRTSVHVPTHTEVMDMINKGQISYETAKRLMGI